MNLQNQLDTLSRRTFCEKWATASLGVTVLHGLGGQSFAETAGHRLRKGQKRHLPANDRRRSPHPTRWTPRNGLRPAGTDQNGPIDFQLGGTMVNLA
ncbi:MAG: hypothetical protein IPK32_11150 [Verrucomicrobiaceae bacterium]|nr:hypothetical protein [Verrucomicrobiaceae bacterium]